MHCALCRSYNKDNTMAIGTSNFRTSTLSRHMSGEDHQSLMFGKSLQRGKVKAWDKAFDNENQAAITAMKAVYYIAKENLPLTKYESMIKLFKNVKADHIQHLSGGEGVDYDTWYSAEQFLESINESITEEVKAKMKAATFITILCDESTDIANHKKLVVWAILMNVEDKEPMPEVIFLTDLHLKHADAGCIALAIMDYLKSMGVGTDKVMGLGTDGASVMTGTKNGLSGRMMRLNPHIINIHCIAHRLALVTSQAAESIPALKDIQQLLTDLFYYYKKSSNKVQALEDIQKILDMPVLKVKEIHSVRWLSFFDAICTVYRCLPSLLTYFDSIKKQKDPKGEGIARKLASQKSIYLMCMMMDILAPVMVMVQMFQQKKLGSFNGKGAHRYMPGRPGCVGGEQRWCICGSVSEGHGQE